MIFSLFYFLGICFCCSATFSQKDKDGIVALHNNLRKSAIPKPKTQMQSLTWHEGLAEAAQNQMVRQIDANGQERCGHSNRRPFTEVKGLGVRFGLNRCFGWTGLYGWEKGMTNWAKTKEEYRYCESECTDENSNCGWYTQMVWAETKYIGCAELVCTEDHLIACFYWPAGNVMDFDTRQLEHPYEVTEETMKMACGASGRRSASGVSERGASGGSASGGSGRVAQNDQDKNAAVQFRSFAPLMLTIIHMLVGH